MYVSNLYSPRIGPHIWLQQYRRTNPENIYKKNLSQIYECRNWWNWETEHHNSVLEIRRLHTAQFHIWKYINGKYWILTGPSFANPLTSCHQIDILTPFWHPWLPTFCPQLDVLASTLHLGITLTTCPSWHHHPDGLVSPWNPGLPLTSQNTPVAWNWS